jgi:hypothetical protein
MYLSICVPPPPPIPYPYLSNNPKYGTVGSGFSKYLDMGRYMGYETTLIAQMYIFCLQIQENFAMSKKNFS